MKCSKVQRNECHVKKRKFSKNCAAFLKCCLIYFLFLRNDTSPQLPRMTAWRSLDCLVASPLCHESTVLLCWILSHLFHVCLIFFTLHTLSHSQIFIFVSCLHFALFVLSSTSLPPVISSFASWHSTPWSCLLLPLQTRSNRSPSELSPSPGSPSEHKRGGAIFSSHVLPPLTFPPCKSLQAT